MVGAAVPLPAAAPVAGSQARSGFSAERLERIDRFYEAKVAKGEMSGIVILIARHGKIVHLKSIGHADIEKSRAMAPDTIFRAYSMTKPIAATALMMLYERGHFQLDEPVSRYIPEFANLRVLRTPTSPLGDTVTAEREPTIHDLLRHTAGFGHGFHPNAVDQEYVKRKVFDLDVTMAEMTSRLAGIPLLYQPGRIYNYSVAPDIEARLVEIFSGMPFDSFVEREILQPLRMVDSGWWVGPDRADRLATLYWSRDGKLTRNDEAHAPPADAVFLRQPWSVNSYAVNHPRKGGSYGMVTTASDYWRFGQMLLNRGSFEGRRLLGPQTVSFMTRNHLDDKQREGFAKGLGWGLGFAVVEDPAAAGFMSSAGAFYWAGAANTHFWVDPEKDLVVVALAQDMGNPGNALLRPQIRTLVYSALLD